MRTICLTATLMAASFLSRAQETLQTVTDRGNTTTNSLQIGGQYVNGNTTKLFINNQSGKNFALSSGANMISEQGFHIYNWTDSPNTPLLSLTNTGSLTVRGDISIANSTGAKLSFNGVNDGTEGATGITWYNPDPLAYGIHRTAGAWAAPDYQQLRLSWHTGIVLDPGTSSSKSYVDVKGDGLRVTSGNVGIGTSNPGNYKLNVMGPISGGVNNYTYNAAVAQLTNESKVDGISGISPTGAFRWYTNPNNSSYHGFLYQLRAYDSMNGESGNLLTINGLGNIGIGIGDANPLFALDIAKGGNNASIHLKRTDLAPSSWYLHSGRLGNGEFSIGDDTQYRMVFLPSGNVGIGTTAPAEKLSVNGKIRAHEIKVETANWPDYVFFQSYQLPTLQETEKHIKEKGHLPGIPSAADVKANGIDVGEMNAKLLQKIEELTLHLIEMKKENTDMKTRMSSLEDEMKNNLKK